MAFIYYTLLVRAEGIGPSTSVLSGQRSTTELRSRTKSNRDTTEPRRFSRGPDSFTRRGYARVVWAMVAKMGLLRYISD